MARLLYANTKDSDMLYAVKVEVPDAFFLLDAGKKQYVFLDHREFGVFQEHNHNPNTELVLLNPLLEEARNVPGTGSTVNKLALLLLKKYDVEKEVIEVSNRLPLDMADYLRSQGVHLKVTIPFYPQRLQKSLDEANKIEDALKRTHGAFEKIEEILKESTVVGDKVLFHDTPLTSEFLKEEVEQILLRSDMLNVEGIIISCGPHAAIPHHRGAGLIRPYQTIVCDIFPRHRGTGYFADMTRTYVKGKPQQKLLDLYAAVRNVQEKAIGAIKPGVVLGEVHQSCIDNFISMGYHADTKGFIHGTGHGLGLDVHEEPYVRTGSDVVAEPGHVVTVEPGLYYPELGGVRIEDVVLVTEDGCRNLTNYPKEFTIP